MDILTKEEQERALDNYIVREPRRIELGGDYYLKCYWISCNADVKSTDKFCPQCGQRLRGDE